MQYIYTQNMALFMHKNVKNPETNFQKKSENARPFGLKNRVFSFHNDITKPKVKMEEKQQEPKSRYER